MTTCYCDYEQPTFFRESQPRAKVRHRCGECSRVIQPGERYNKITGKWDGEFRSYARCAHCEAVAAALRVLPCFCDYYGGLWETVGDGWLDDLREAQTGDYFSVMRLVAAAKKARRANRHEVEKHDAKD